MKSDKSPIAAAEETVDCPVHHMPLKAVRRGDSVIAICTCPVHPNPWAGKEVYERLPDLPDTSSRPAGEGAI